MTDASSAGFSNSQLKGIGERIRKSRATSADWDAFYRFRAQHVDVLCQAMSRIAELLRAFPKAVVSARIKNTATISDKLRRDRTALHRMHDIAGVRVVLDEPIARGRRVQDDVAKAISRVGFLDGAELIDRRRNPQQGYRAVHLVGTMDGRWVEIQIRTSFQHRWATMFERLADGLGRDIRYGKPPTIAHLTIAGAQVSSAQLVDEATQTSDSIADGETTGSEREAERAAAELELFEDVLKNLPLAENANPPWDIDDGASDAGLGWFLVSYNRSTGVCVRRQMLPEPMMRNAWRSQEKAYRDDDNVEVVLMNSKSLETLQQTHDRYFTSMPGV